MGKCFLDECGAFDAMPEVAKDEFCKHCIYYGKKKKPVRSIFADSLEGFDFEQLEREAENGVDIEALNIIQNSMDSLDFCAYLKGSAINYLWAYDHNGEKFEDLRKAIFYVNKLIDVVASTVEEEIPRHESKGD